ncbi:hypothetical protein [Oceanobacillus oncorhynchi]|uniref:hypothetical protein n=1 Tax=Oceanobacillus oncorhynchi TaxID=545501 RepID=UPI0034D54319
MTADTIKGEVVNSILVAFKEKNTRIGDACTYTSYMAKDILKNIFGLNAELKAGELHFNDFPVYYAWNPPEEFHMWLELDGEKIDIAIAGLLQREEFQKGGKFYRYRNHGFDVVWERFPYGGQIYKEVNGGVDMISPPDDEDDYKELLESAYNYIRNQEYRNK